MDRWINKQTEEMIIEQRQEKKQTATLSVSLIIHPLTVYLSIHHLSIIHSSIYPDKNTTKFKEWLDIAKLIPSYKPSQGVIELFGYLAYETVQEVSVWTNKYTNGCIN